MEYKNKDVIKTKYDELGSTRRVGKYFNVANGTIIYWMRKYGLPRIPKLHLYNNNSGKGRLGELYILGHPYFRNNVVDIELIDDKHAVDLIWRGDKVNVKTSHYKRPIFRIKNKDLRHKVAYYICLFFIDSISPLIPTEVWVIPAKKCGYGGLGPGLGKQTKFHRHRLSLIRNKKFSSQEEEKYNEWFAKKYQNCLANN